MGWPVAEIGVVEPSRVNPHGSPWVWEQQTMSIWRATCMPPPPLHTYNILSLICLYRQSTRWYLLLWKCQKMSQRQRKGQRRSSARWTLTEMVNIFVCICVCFNQLLFVLVSLIAMEELDWLNKQKDTIVVCKLPSMICDVRVLLLLAVHICRLTTGPFLT